MNKQLMLSFGIIVFAVVAFCCFSLTPFYSQADASPVTSPVQMSDSFEYGRLVSENGNYNWIVGGNQLQRNATTIPDLINRLGGRATRGNFANLLDTIGGLGWDLVQVTDGGTWVFKRNLN